MGRNVLFSLRAWHHRSQVTSSVACGVSWPSGLAYRTQVLVLAAECGFESRPWHLCPWARHLIIIASLHPGVKWVPVYSPRSWDGFRNDLWAWWALWAGVIMRLEHHLVGGYVRYISPYIIIIILCECFFSPSPLMNIVGGGSMPKFAENTVLIWDDAKKKFILELTFSISHPRNPPPKRQVCQSVH